MRLDRRQDPEHPGHATIRRKSGGTLNTMERGRGTAAPSIGVHEAAWSMAATTSQRRLWANGTWGRLELRRLRLTTSAPWRERWLVPMVPRLAPAA